MKVNYNQWKIPIPGILKNEHTASLTVQWKVVGKWAHDYS